MSLPGKMGTSIIAAVQDLSLHSSVMLCVTFQNNEDLNCTAAKASKHVQTLYKILLELKVTIMIWHNIYKYVLIFR